MTRHPTFAPVIFTILAVLWTWPALLAPGWVGRESDTLGTIWVIDAAARLLGNKLHDAHTAWPTGVDYLRPDSFLLLGAGTLSGWLGAARVHAWLQILGLVLSAWAAESCARQLGATRPASLVAGIGYTFGGIASTTLLEGHVYQLVNPWLPLCLAAWWRATGPEGRPRDGVATAAFFGLALASTAYLGMAAAVLLGGVLLGALVERRNPIRPAPLLAALAVGIPVSAAYLALFLAGATPWASVSAGATGAPTTLLSLLGPTETSDTFYHGQVGALPPTILALFVAAPVVLRGAFGWRRVGVAALVALVFALGAELQVDPALRLFPLPLALLDMVPGAHFLHFPSRLGWGFGLCAGVLAALVVSRLPTRRAWLLVPLLLLDVFGFFRLPWRQRVQLAEVPSAYLADTGPVLDLFPEDAQPGRPLSLRIFTLACAYQTLHHRPIADTCITTSPWNSPRATLGRWLYRQALDGTPFADDLADLGFTTVAFHGDLFRATDRAVLDRALRAMDPAPVESRDGGEAIGAFAVPAGGGGEPVAAWERLFVGR